MKSILPHKTSEVLSTKSKWFSHRGGSWIACPVCNNKKTVRDKKTHKERKCTMCNGTGKIELK